MATVDTTAFLRSLKALGRDLERAFDRSAVKNSQTLLEESQKLAPFKTGELQNTVTANVEGQAFTVTFSVEYAALRHNKLDDTRGPGTTAKPSTKYGVPGPNYLQNPAKGLGKDNTYHKVIKKETEKSKFFRRGR